MKKIFAVLFLLLPVAAFAEGAKVGEPAPDFTAQDTRGKVQSVSQYKGQIVVLEWTNPQCPFVKKHYEVDNMQQLQRYARQNEVVWLSINSGAPGKQGNITAEEVGKLRAKRKSAEAATILDVTGVIGKAYGAKTTPHIFIINANGTLVYQGAIDDIPSGDPADVPNARNFVRQALDELIDNKPVSIPVTQPYGCSVKY